MDTKFVHLRLHSEFSLRDGLITIPQLVEKCSELHYPAVAITDYCNLYGTIKFYQSARQQCIKPIIGVDIFLKQDKNPKGARLTLLSMNKVGYQNLLHLISRAFLEGQDAEGPKLEYHWLNPKSSEGLIALSGGQYGDIGLALLEKNPTTAIRQLEHWLNCFPNRFYIELSRVGKPDENAYIKAVMKLADQYQVPVVATNDVRFIAKEDFEAHEARVCIQQGVILNDPQRERDYTEQQYLKSADEMQKLFADIPEALENSVEIAKRCNTTITLGKTSLPHFEVPDGLTTEEHLSLVAKEGLLKRLRKTLQNDALEKKLPAYEQRLNHELSVINTMGFAGYFLIVADFTQWAKENGVPVGPGRGSGPGSLVAYSLEITDLDPLKHELLFERFLNPERVSMPDFDIDFCMDGRDRVIDYVMQRHGRESVSQIITYGTMAAKAVIRDVGRVLGNGYGFVDKIAKLIPFELGMTLDKALVQEPLLKERYHQEEEVKTLIDLALKLEGITRNVGKHAGGIVIAPGKLTDFVPLYCEAGESKHPVTQFDKDDVEAVGLVKFDFLGLKTLTIIDKALHTVNQTRAENHEAPIDISLIPHDDQQTFQLLKSCQSTAVFQLESHGMRDLIKRLQPDCFEDLIALVALFRPGPLQSGMVEDFINRKHGKAKVIYPHPHLEPILKPTYGVIVYQEQVMQIAQILAGYTLGAADILRRAMGKKKPEEMAKQRIIFCEGAVKRGVDDKLAGSIFDLMEKFAGYGFNKSHSASYALIAYQTAWLKTHYPADFMAAVLSSDMDKTEKVLIALDECEAIKLHVSPPDINRSAYEFKVAAKDQLMYGLGAIKGVGEAAIESIIQVRDVNGPFTDFFDFCQRVDLRKVNKRVIEALIKSGCFDSLGHHRASLFASIGRALQSAEQALSDFSSGQHDLLGALPKKVSAQYVDVDKWPDEKQLQGEKETLGFYLTGHPLNQHLDELAHITTCRIGDLNSHNHHQVCLAGIITGIRQRQTKRGDRIGILTLDDGTGELDVVCFSEPYQQFRHLLVADQLVLIEGEVSHDDFSNRLRMVGREILTLEQAREKHAKHLVIEISEFLTKNKDLLDLDKLKNILKRYAQGSCTVSLKLQQNNVQTKVQFGKNWFVKPSIALIDALKSEFNGLHVRLEY